MPVRKKDVPWNFSDSDLYSSPYPGTAVGNVDHLLERSPLFSESADQKDSNYGKGPKGWTRSDKSLEEEVCLFLFENPAVDASDIEVEVKEGIVYLRGSVKNRYMKWVAERSIEGIDGIKDIMNLLDFKEPAQ